MGFSRRTAATVLLAVVPPSVAAQQPERAVVLPQVPASASAAALGGAYVLGSSEPEALYYNPAASGSFGLLAASVQWYGEGTVHGLAAGGTLVGVPLAIGLRALDYGIRPLSTAAGEERLNDTGPRTVTERMLTVGVARRLFGVRTGLAVKAIERRERGVRSVSPALDVSTGVSLGAVQLGLSAHELGPAMTVGQEDVDLPARATLGASTRSRSLGPLDVLAAVAATAYFDGEVVGGGGLEVSYWPIQGRTFAVRAGWREQEEPDADPLTLGGAVTLDSFTVDYAWQRFDAAHVHRVGIRLR
jgi:hypothetical protein